jgi:ubiquinone biosynthesis protein
MKPSHLPRYTDIARLLLKYRGAFISVAENPDEDDDASKDAKQLASDLEAMGPTFVKLGQLLSTRADVLPPIYLNTLKRLQDHVVPVPYVEIERVVNAELGVRISKAFSEFSERPAAAASLGQVHRAKMRDGRDVAVKVQRPNIRGQIVEDMEVIDEIATFVDKHTETGRRYEFATMVQEFRVSLMAELDYRAEARNLTVIHDNLARYERIVVPLPIEDYSTSLVLTMDWAPGRALGSLGPLDRLDLDGHDLAEDLFRAYLDQILFDGIFHADPHPGNILLTDDGRLALIDMGMVARVSTGVQDALIKLLLALSEGRGADAADVLAELGEQLPDFDIGTLRRSVDEVVGRSLTLPVEDLQAGSIIGQVLRAAGEAGLRPPGELTMIGKAMLNLDEVARILDPTFEPNATIQRHIEELMHKKMLKSASPGNILASAMEVKEFAEKFPGRINKVMDALAEGQLTLNIQGIDEKELMRGIQKLANRVTTGVVVAALVVGAALIMPINVGPKLFGYPALALALFLLAALAAGWLLVSIVLSDVPQLHSRLHRHRRPKHRE